MGSIVLLRFNGVSNVLTYALNSQMARSTVLPPDVLDDRGPRDNEFVHWAGASNVRVGFDFWEHEEHFVARVQRVALRRSEHETASLEVVRDDSDARATATCEAKTTCTGDVSDLRHSASRDSC